MKLYVGNMNYSTTENELQEIFKQCGNVLSARIIIDKDSGNSKGFGFVEMETNDEGNAAIENLNEIEFKGRPLTVNLARPKTK